MRAEVRIQVTQPPFVIRARRARSLHRRHGRCVTFDITPELRTTITIEAFRRGITIADMPRNRLPRVFPSSSGETS